MTRRGGPTVDDTQVVRRRTPPAASIPPALPKVRRRRRGGCLSPLVWALLVLMCAVGGLALVGYAALTEAHNAPRTNVLILGLDRRPEESSAVRSDTLILMTVYPQGARVGLLSIPRDLYVEIPGYEQNRINTAHFWGENEAEGRGPWLAMQTVEHNFGVPVDRYVRLDFDGFRAIVDAVGGVDIYVEETIVDDAYPTEDYGTIRIEIPAGQQHMDGETALRYARSRHSSSDFERAERQQQVVIALARRVLEPGSWPQWPVLFTVVMDNVDTNLSAWDMLLMVPTLQRVGPQGIEHRVIDRTMTDAWTTDSGAQVLLPRWDAIQPVVQELFTP